MQRSIGEKIEKSGYILRIFVSKNLVQDQKGGVLVYVALSMLTFFALVGVATDSGRGYLLQGRLSHALDAAALAGGRVMAVSDQARDDDITDYFNANFPPGYLGAAVEGPFISADEDNEVLTITARATIRTTFMQFLGIPTITVSARTVVRRSNRGLELAIVLDNTGSMCTPCSKLEDLKAAATDLVDILFGDEEQPPALWAGLVPYVTSVNVGNAYTDWLRRDIAPEPGFDRGQPLTAYHPAYYQPTAWRGCMEARRDPYDLDDSPRLSSRSFPISIRIPECGIGGAGSTTRGGAR